MYGVTRFAMDSGERNCLVVEHSNGLPLFYPNLYLTTQLRNRSVALATMEAEASHLVVLLRYLDRRGIDLELRFTEKQFFKDYELDDLRDFTQRKLRKLPADVPSSSMFSLEELEESTEQVSNGTQYVRLTAITNYLGWFAKHLLVNAERGVVEHINEMCAQIKARRPEKKGRNNDRREKSLSDEQLEVLFEVIRPGSELNPFAESVQRRNRLMILMLFHLGIRGGELLNIRNKDIETGVNHRLRIVRRADEKDDTRTNEPNAKTLGRLLPLGDVLAKELDDYIKQERRKIPNSNRSDFLFITHKEGPTQGQPISKAAYHKIIAVVRAVSPQLRGMSGHMLRHTWNRKFSERMDSMDSPPSEERQEQIRSFLMGWKEGSGTAAIYNRRFAEQKGHEASLDMQKTSGMRVPRNLNSEK
jgi:integrase